MACNRLDLTFDDAILSALAVAGTTPASRKLYVQNALRG
jgi:hypothetical protein